MTPNISAQIIAQAWLDEGFAQALRGADAYAVIQDVLGVSLPAGVPIPEIPPAPKGAVLAGLGVKSGVCAGAALGSGGIYTEQNGRIVGVDTKKVFAVVLIK